MTRWRDNVVTKSAAKPTMPIKLKAINLYAELTPPRQALSAKFVLTKPNATITTKTLYTDQDGKAVAQFSLGTTYAKGTYKGVVSLTVDGKVLTHSGSIVI